jgi:hypothetical protein
MSATVVRINDLADKPPVIEVVGAPGGHNIYVGPLVNNASVEHGALINLLGVDQEGSIGDQGWRLVDPNLPEDTTRNGLNIIWITHDRSGPFSNGDLQIGFNSVYHGHHYANPIHTNDKSLGPASNRWVTVYSDEVLVLLFKPCEGKPG